MKKEELKELLSRLIRYEAWKRSKNEGRECLTYVVKKLKIDFQSLELDEKMGLQEDDFEIKHWCLKE